MIAAACGSPATAQHPPPHSPQESPAQTPAAAKIVCTDPSQPHHAYVVVQHMSGAWLERCVSFTGELIDGQTVMDGSGIEYQAEPVSSGKVVCQVDLEPKQYTQCFPQNQPYWALFVEANGGWTPAPGGYTAVHLHDGEALGWHYVKADDPNPAPPPLAISAPAD